MIRHDGPLYSPMVTDTAILLRGLEVVLQAEGKIFALLVSMTPISGIRIEIHTCFNPDMPPHIRAGFVKQLIGVLQREQQTS